ncbi:helix-turn-helix domain-containing protein [Coralloluteibacterium thermophilus]|uniref:Helix-turn-helix domain-containing protein n=1 Tax=Coralloluteibacterium thermophilum TaxID=2707049 RepID=A0ABV9NFT1_9GAMM
MNTQREFPLIAGTRAPERLPAHLVGLCRSSAEALRLAIQYGKKTQAFVADALGMERAQLSRILSGIAHFPADKALEFAYLVGNWGWHQWVAHSCGMDLVPRVETVEERILRLEAENARLRAA